MPLLDTDLHDDPMNSLQDDDFRPRSSSGGSRTLVKLRNRMRHKSQEESSRLQKEQELTKRSPGKVKSLFDSFRTKSKDGRNKQRPVSNEAKDQQTAQPEEVLRDPVKEAELLLQQKWVQKFSSVPKHYSSRLLYFMRHFVVQ